MRRILIVGDRMPFVETPSDPICGALVDALHLLDADVEHIALPQQRSGHSLDELVARRALDVWNVERLIAVSFPACLIAHDQKVVWLLDRQERAPDEAPGLRLGLFDAKRVYTTSKLARKRLHDATGCHSRILAPPLDAPGWRRAAIELLR